MPWWRTSKRSADSSASSACEAYLYMPLKHFVYAPAVRHVMRKLFYRLAQHVGSPYALYVPDSSFSPSKAICLANEGLSLDEIHRFLCEHVGPPGLDPKATTANPDLWTGTTEDNWWFVDDFADLHAR